MWIIDEILTILKDGHWHDLKEIAKKCSSNELRVEMIISFLSEYGFIKLDKKSEKARLPPLMLEFINKIQQIRIEKAVKT